MSGLQLEAVDSGRRIALSPGETVIGRGPFLGVADKRVSRNHGVLEVVDEKLRIKAMHVNPCFYQAYDNSQLLPLERNEWHWLCPGDCFSLLPDKYVFRVIATHSDMDSTLRNSQMLEEDISSNDEPKLPSDTLETKPSSVEKPSCSTNGTFGKAPSQEKRAVQTEETFSTLSQTEQCKEEIEQSKHVPRKRVLPVWMLQGDLEIPECSVTKEGDRTAKRGGRGRGRGRSKMEPAKSGENMLGRKRLSPADVSEGTSETEQDQEKKTRLKAEPIDIATQLKAVCEPSVAIIIGNTEMMDKKDASQGAEVPGPENNRQEPGCKQNTNMQPLTYATQSMSKIEEREMTTSLENEPSQSFPQSETSCSPDVKAFDSASGTDSPPSSKQTHSMRIACIYGTNCYRKNPVHFLQFSHPGDSDYLDAADGSQDDNDDRPECPYGTDCYRKNPQHKLEYKHTKSPETEASRPRRKTSKKGKSALDDESDNDGVPNEYDLNDSFIDDEEEEESDHTDEDSDWEPNSEDKDAEDMETLLKEAQKFVKTKK
ncbi:aprataxin and PNK-like factor [Microcaecilia unicolor]|uniref:Aprataxin and PNK-like factor n=1 Tax=Microcaecilia unicolor TaxID=1415580 RepID=A0A6P7XPB8_9AMPH|nr:aprataxin and PNK-like factor [Microcaecilia unicolor]